jgi:plasmid stabilization system protein ParE
MGADKWQVILSAQAERDLRDIVAFIAADNPRRCRAIWSLIFEAEALKKLPHEWTNGIRIWRR